MSWTSVTLHFLLVRNCAGLRLGRADGVITSVATAWIGYAGGGFQAQSPHSRNRASRRRSIWAPSTFSISRTIGSCSGFTNVYASPVLWTQAVRPIRCVGIDRVRHVKVDHMRDLCDIDATRGDVGGDENVVLASRKPSIAFWRWFCDIFPCNAETW